MANQNITLSLPEGDLREARLLAARRGTSVSQLLARMHRETVERESGYDAARERSLARCTREQISVRAARRPGPGTTCMSGNRQFVDTNILVYAHDVTAGDKHSRARALVEELWGTRQEPERPFWDAMILRSAQELGCQILHTEDLNAGREYDGVEVRNPFPA
jgi:hypothetical protein